MDGRVSELIIEPTNLLLEDETHSARYHGHTTEYASAQKSRITFILGPAVLCHLIATFIVNIVDKGLTSRLTSLLENKRDRAEYIA